MKRIAALISLIIASAFGLTVVVAATGAAPANADVRFCQTAPGSPCIGPVNGCTITLGGGQYVFVSDGDSVLDNFGHRLTCKNGKWVTTVALTQRSVDVNFMVGGGRVDVQSVPCDPNQVFCP